MASVVASQVQNIGEQNKVQDAANSNRPHQSVVDGVEVDTQNQTSSLAMLKQVQAQQEEQQRNNENDDEHQEESKSSSKSASKSAGNNNNKSKSSSKSFNGLNLNPANTLVNGCTPLEEQFQDAVSLIQSDVERAARVANVYRHYDAVEVPRNITEDINEFGRRTVSAFIEKAPTSKTTDIPEDASQPFYVVDLGQIVMQYAKFQKHLPGVKIHYAMKCNNSESIVAMIAALGGSYDCASLAEIKQVLEPGYARTHIMDRTHPEGAVNPRNSKEGGKIIFANPCKQPYHMQQAEALGVQRTTFDNQDELIKIREYMPNAEAVLRIKTDDGSAVCQFSCKFGCPRSEAKDLMSFAKEIGVNIVGVSFHVGSGNNDPTAYHTALKDARNLFDYGINELGFKMTLLDLGGGWAGADPLPKPDGSRDLSFEELTAAIRPVLYELFPLDQTEIIAEPGRFFGAGCHTLCLNVHSKRRVQHSNGQTEHQYYLTDGAYHSFNCMIFDHQVPNFQIVDERGSSSKETRLTTMFGPTCDSLDVVMKCEQFPELKVGDWLFVPEFGAYTCAAGSAFNGFSTRRKEYISCLPSGVVPYLAE